MSGPDTPTTVSRVLAALQSWARELINLDHHFDRLYLFGSLVYKGGQQFVPESDSDVDLLVRLAGDVVAPIQFVQACDSLLTRKRELEQKLARVIGSPGSKPRVSAVVVSRFELEQGIHKDGKLFFFADSDFLDLLDPSKSAVPLTRREGDIALQPTYLYALSAIQRAQKIRNKFLAVGPFGECGIEAWDGSDAVPKDLMRAAAHLRYFAEDLKDKSNNDLNLGLEYLHSLVQRWGKKGSEYAQLAEWLTVRRGGRGPRALPLLAMPHLLLSEILGQDAVERLRQRLTRRPSIPVVATDPALTDEAGFLARARDPLLTLKLGKLDLGSKLFPTHLWDAERSQNLYVYHPESDRRVELVWVPSALPPNLLSGLVSELEAKLGSLPPDADGSASDQSPRLRRELDEVYRRLTEEGSNPYLRLAGNPTTLTEDDRVTLQVPIGPSRYGVALITEKNLMLPTAQLLSWQHILNSLAVRVAYIFTDTDGRKWIEFQERQQRENATYSGAWDVSAAGYIDPQRHEDPREPGLVSPWRACASELQEELRIPRAELLHRDHYYFLGVGRNDPTGQLDLLAYYLGSYVPDTGRKPSAFVCSYDRCPFEPESVAAFVRSKRHWVPTALLTLVLALEASDHPKYSMQRIEDAFAICANALDLSP